MKILFVSQYFPPEMGAPSARVHEFAREWVRAGHQVSVLTGFPNHPTGVIPEAYRGSLFRRERVDGIEVVRTPIYAAANRGRVRRSVNYVSFALSASVIGPLLVKRPDIIVATSPQILTAVAGLWLSRLMRVPFVFDVRDLWPRSIIEVGAMRSGTPTIRLLEAVERQLYQHADHIVAVTHSFVDEIVATGSRRSRISVVTNGVDLDLFRQQGQEAARRRLGLPPDKFLVTYVGTHGMAHGLDVALDAAKLLRADGTEFLFVGEGAEKTALRTRARAEGIENVTFWDQRPRDEIAEVLAASDVALVLLRDRPLFRTVIPSKIFEIMGAGRAVVSTVDGEARQIMERAGAGLFVPPERPDQLAGALRTLTADPGRREAMGASGRSYAAAHYSRPALAAEYLKVLSSVLEQTPPLIAPSGQLNWACPSDWLLR